MNDNFEAIEAAIDQFHRDGDEKAFLARLAEIVNGRN